MSIDTVNDLPRRNQYVASAAQTVFDYTFPIFLEADLVVYVNDVLKSLSTHYTVQGETDDLGGTITFLTPMAGGEIVTIYSDIAIERDTDFQQNGPLASSNFNDELDKLVVICQDLKAKIGRAIRWPFTAAQTSEGLELTPLANWYGKFLRVSSTGFLEAAEVASSLVALSQSVIGALLNPTTTIETGLGFSPVAKWYKTGHVERYQVNTTPGTTDMTFGFATAASVCQATSGGAGVLMHGEPGATYLIDTSLSIRQAHADFSECKIVVGTGTKILTIGGNSNQAINVTQKFHEVVRSGGVNSTPTLRVIGAKGAQINVRHCDYMQLYADTDDSTGHSIAYAHFELGYIETFEINTNPAPSGSTVQWINENTFKIDRCKNFLCDGTYGHNHNRFWGGSFEEGGAGSTIEFRVGSSNTWHDVRFEGSGHDVKFGATTFDNRVFWAYASNQRVGFEPPSLNPGTVLLTDLGEANALIRTNQTFQARIPLLLVNATTCRTYTTVNGGTTNGLTDNITSLAGVDLQRLGVETFHRNNFRGIYKSALIPIERGDAIEIESDATIYRHYVQSFDVNRALITDAGGGANMLRTDGGMTWNAGNNYYTQGSNVDRCFFAPKDDTVKYVQFLITTGGSTLGVAIRWLNAWMISARGRTVKLAGVGLAGRAPGATASPTIGFAQAGELLANPAGGTYDCVFAMDTTNSNNEAAAATVIEIPVTTGIVVGDIAGLVLNDGTTHWTTVSAIGGGPDITVGALPSAMDAGHRVVINRWRQDLPDNVSTDRGDTSQTLTIGTDKTIQRWATALTANRTVTLSTTGAREGNRFRVVRTGLGAFTLDVGGLKTIPNTTAAFVDVVYTGSAWVLSGYGTL